MRHLLFLVLIIFSGFGLTAQQDSTLHRMIPDPDYMPTLDVLPSIPAEAPPCGCRFAADEDAFAAGQFRFVTTAMFLAEPSSAFIMVSGTYFRLERTDLTEDETLIMAEFQSAPYILRLEIPTASGADNRFIRGKMTFTDPYHGTVQLPVIGRCGCG